MNTRIITRFAIAAIFLLFISCQKSRDKFAFFRNPLEEGCQVAEFHIAFPDYPVGIHFPFKKTFDASGKIVKEIDCFFWPEVGPNSILLPYYHHIFKIEQQGRTIFFIKKDTIGGSTPDTVARAILTKEGRPKSCASNSELFVETYFAYYDTSVTEEYIYRNDRIVAVKNIYTGLSPITTVDSLQYDRFGNLLSFAGNSYEYDYSKTGKQQFYSEDYQGNSWPFYLLQYLGFFPEVNSPVNIRTHIVGSGDYYGSFFNHTFDAGGKLISYNFGNPPGTPGAPPDVTITWNCTK